MRFIKLIIIVFSTYCFLYSFSYSGNNFLPDKDTTLLSDYISSRRNVVNPHHIMLSLSNKKNISLFKFTSTNGKFDFIDLDNDGNRELIVYLPSSKGLHPLDWVYFFKNIDSTKFIYAGKIVAAYEDIEITSDQEFILDIHHAFSYFFSCYACYYDYPAATIISHIKLRYNKGRLQIITDEKARNVLAYNMSLFAKDAYPVLQQELDKDEGQRKVMAINLAVYHYLMGRNFSDTKNFFYAYYKKEDAELFWKKFVDEVKAMDKLNDF